MPPLVTQSALVLIPGAIVTAALFPPGSLSIAGRLALTFVAGYSAVVFITWVLAVASALTATTLLAGLGLLSVGLAVLAWRRGSPAHHWRAVRDELRGDPWTNLVGIVVLVAVAWTRLGASPLYSLTSRTALRFWGDGVEIAAAGEIPQRTLQWGQSIEPAASKMLFNCFSAAMELVGGPHALPNLTGATWLGAVALVPALWWLGRELGLGFTAPILPLVIVANLHFVSSEFTTDLTPYRAESFGRMVAFSGLALAIASIRAKAGWSRFLVAGVLFSVAALTHLVPTVVALGLLFWLAVYELARRRLSLKLVTRLAAGFAVAALVVPAVWFLPGASVGFSGLRGSAPVVSGNEDIDPTLFFSAGRRVQLEDIQSRDWYTPPAALARRLVQDTIDSPVKNGWLWLVVAAAVAIALTVVSPERLRPVGVASLALGVNVLAATLLFARVYDSMAMAQFGPRRLVDYTSISFWLVILLVAELLLIGLSRLDPRVPVAVLLASAVVLMVVFLPTVREAQAARPRMSDQIEVLDWIRDNLPCDVRILSNRRTSGSFQVLTGRVGVNEGMGPFFRPQLLAGVNQFLIEMNKFYRDPLEGRAFLAEYGVDYVVLFRGVGPSRDLRDAQGFPQELEQAGFLELVGRPGVANIYRVNGVETTGEFPEPSDHPGYTCRSGKIQI